jgi:hypothetical protein
MKSFSFFRINPINYIPKMCEYTMDILYSHRLVQGCIKDSNFFLGGRLLYQEKLVEYFSSWEEKYFQMSYNVLIALSRILLFEGICT